MPSTTPAAPHHCLVVKVNIQIPPSFTQTSHHLCYISYASPKHISSRLPGLGFGRAILHRRAPLFAFNLGKNEALARVWDPLAAALGQERGVAGTDLSQTTLVGSHPSGQLGILSGFRDGLLWRQQQVEGNEGPDQQPHLGADGVGPQVEAPQQCHGGQFIRRHLWKQSTEGRICPGGVEGVEAPLGAQPTANPAPACLQALIRTETQ